MVPSWDLKTLWVTGSAGKHSPGSLTSIDPTVTGKPTRVISVDDAYNMYFTPDGGYAVVVAEELKNLEYPRPTGHGPESHSARARLSLA